MGKFIDQLYREITISLENNYPDNYDEERFGIKREMKGFRSMIRNRVEKGYISKVKINQALSVLKEITEQSEAFQFLYDHLEDEESKKWMVAIWAYRALGEKYVKLPVNSSYYWETLEKIKSIKDEKDLIDPKFLHFKLHKYDLRKLGKDASLYFIPQGILMDFFLEQYRYKNGNKVIETKEGDTVIDAGGCWGDTALYFAGKANPAGKVYSFEFIPGNIEIFKKNISLNPTLAPQIELVENPVWNRSGQKIFFSDNGPGSKVSIEDFGEAFGSKETVSIDDFVENKKIDKIDFIKMDIEGAEPMALEGSVRTIRKFKPNLAIAIYHSTGDFIEIPKWVIAQDLGYKIYMGHYTIHSEETILFATAR